MTSLVIRPEAEADIEDAYLWYEAQSSGLGDDFLGALDAALSALVENPARFPILHREPDAAVRRALVKRFPFGLYFVSDSAGATVTLIACLHARRDPKHWLRRVVQPG
ncbi:MAG: type II toxin-antitoxin system RelE/ParE family toxin [Longimicrobiales bacterium]